MNILQTKRACVLIMALFCLASCSNNQGSSEFSKAVIQDSKNQKINQEGRTIEQRFLVPNGFDRVPVVEHSYQQYLRLLPLKPDGTLVSFYTGEKKTNDQVYCAVIDKPIGQKNLHQCADAIMHLRGDYLWRQKKYNEITFNLTNGFPLPYSEWQKGKRLIVNGNKTTWSAPKNSDSSYESFWKYLEVVFMYAGTLSLSKELKPISISEAKIGDIFIQGGSPGHAIVIVDHVIRKSDGKQLFLLAQSYMPAQEIQILLNPKSKADPWFEFPAEGELLTPEWRFQVSDLMRF